MKIEVTEEEVLDAGEGCPSGSVVCFGTPGDRRGWGARKMDSELDISSQSVLAAIRAENATSSLRYSNVMIFAEFTVFRDDKWQLRSDPYIAKGFVSSPPRRQTYWCDKRS